MVESATKIGKMLGHLCTGLADVDGYYLPFVVVGLLPIPPAIMAVFTIPTIATSRSTQAVSILALLRTPGVLIMAITTIIFITPVMLEGTLAPHLTPYRLSMTVLGCVFLIEPLCYVVATAILGRVILRRVKYKLPLMVGGGYGMSQTYML